MDAHPFSVTVTTALLSRKALAGQHNTDFFTLYGKEEVNSNIETDNLGITVFQKTKDDKQALSIEDQTFLQIMDREAYQDVNHSWVAPLPFSHTQMCFA